MSFNTERLSHAYITDSTFADTLAMAVVCSTRDGERPCKRCIHCDKASRHIHPDIIEVSRLDNKLIISVDQIRELKKDVYIVPNEAAQKAYVIKDADSMNTNAQNAFLQVLEEPPAHAVFILSTDNPAAFLPTVYSRCVDLKSQSPEVTYDETDDLDELEEIVSGFIEAVTGDNVKMMECMFRIDKFDRHTCHTFLTMTRERIVQELKKNISTDSLNVSEKLINAESVLVKADEMLNLNVSAGHISGFICARLL